MLSPQALMAEQFPRAGIACRIGWLRCCSPKSASRNNVGRLIPDWQLPERDWASL